MDEMGCVSAHVMHGEQRVCAPMFAVFPPDYTTQTCLPPEFAAQEVCASTNRLVLYSETHRTEKKLLSRL